MCWFKSFVRSHTQTHTFTQFLVVLRLFDKFYSLELKRTIIIQFVIALRNRTQTYARSFHHTHKQTDKGTNELMLPLLLSTLVAESFKKRPLDRFRFQFQLQCVCVSSCCCFVARCKKQTTYRACWLSRLAVRSFVRLFTYSYKQTSNNNNNR